MLWPVVFVLFSVFFTFVNVQIVRTYFKAPEDEYKEIPASKRIASYRLQGWVYKGFFFLSALAALSALHFSPEESRVYISGILGVWAAIYTVLSHYRGRMLDSMFDRESSTIRGGTRQAQKLFKSFFGSTQLSIYLTLTVLPFLRLMLMAAISIFFFATVIS